MKLISQDIMNNAVLFKLFVIAQEETGYQTSSNVVDSFSFPVGAKRVELAYENLDERGLADVYSQRASISGKGYTYVEEQLVEAGSFLAQYALNGDEWLENQTYSVGDIPAADRIVTIDDNQAEIDQILEGLEAIEKELIEDNAVGAELGDEKELLIAEIEASKNLTKNDRFRLKSLVALLVPALKFLSEKFAGSAVSALAKKLITLLFSGF